MLHLETSQSWKCSSLWYDERALDQHSGAFAGTFAGVATKNAYLLHVRSVSCLPIGTHAAVHHVGSTKGACALQLERGDVSIYHAWMYHHHANMHSASVHYTRCREAIMMLYHFIMLRRAWDS